LNNNEAVLKPFAYIRIDDVLAVPDSPINKPEFEHIEDLP